MLDGKVYFQIMFVRTALLHFSYYWMDRNIIIFQTRKEFIAVFKNGLRMQYSRSKKFHRHTSLKWNWNLCSAQHQSVYVIQTALNTIKDFTSTFLTLLSSGYMTYLLWILVDITRLTSLTRSGFCYCELFAFKYLQSHTNHEWIACILYVTIGLTMILHQRF